MLARRPVGVLVGSVRGSVGEAGRLPFEGRRTREVVVRTKEEAMAEVYCALRHIEL